MLTTGVINFELYNQMVHTHHSTAIEGSTLTLLETQTLLEKGLTAGGKPLEHQLMVVDHQAAQQLVLDWATQNEPINRDRIRAAPIQGYPYRLAVIFDDITQRRSASLACFGRKLAHLV